MRRRDFIAALGAATAWPCRTVAQSRRRVVGVLDTSPRELNLNFDAFRHALFERGYAEGQSLMFEYRSAEGKNEKFGELAGELVRLKVDVIVTRGTPAALAARAATATIPVVMAAAGDPSGIARNPARPARNMTGFGASVRGAEGKRVEVLHDMLPGTARLAGLMNLSNPSRQAEWAEMEERARVLGIEPRVLDVRSFEDIARAFDAASGWPADALVVGSDTVVQTNQKLVIALAAGRRMPAIYTFRDFVEAGGLSSYGVNLPDLYRRAAGYVDKILSGATPEDLPIAQPSKSELIINVRTAEALGLSISKDFLARADALIE